MKEMRERAMGYMGRVLQAQGTDSKKAVRQELTSVLKKKGRPLWLYQSERAGQF